MVGAVAGAVVKFQVLSDARAVPALSLMPGFTVTE